MVHSGLNAALSVNIARKCTGRISKFKLDNTECNARSSRVIALLAFNSFASQASLIDRARSTAEKFHIFGSVHAMKTEIPPFDSDIKDSTNSSL